ncbi:MAG TPA: hypothetical protein VEX11_18550 [Acetobacteraceae bacterium]|nr:hypothetical protein [Acetobacteraceae bacterium]
MAATVEVDLHSRPPAAAVVATVLHPTDPAARAGVVATIAADRLVPAGPRLSLDRRRAMDEALIDNVEAELASALGLPLQDVRADRAQARRFLAEVEGEAQTLNGRLAAAFAAGGGLAAILDGPLPARSASDKKAASPRRLLSDAINRIAEGAPIRAARLLLTCMTLVRCHEGEFKGSLNNAAKVLTQAPAAAGGITAVTRLRTLQEDLRDQRVQVPLLAAILAEMDDAAGRLLRFSEIPEHLWRLLSSRVRIARAFSYEPDARHFAFEHRALNAKSRGRILLRREAVEYRVTGVAGGVPPAGRVPLRPLPGALTEFADREAPASLRSGACRKTRKGRDDRATRDSGSGSGA